MLWGNDVIYELKPLILVVIGLGAMFPGTPTPAKLLGALLVVIGIYIRRMRKENRAEVRKRRYE